MQLEEKERLIGSVDDLIMEDYIKGHSADAGIGIFATLVTSAAENNLIDNVKFADFINECKKKLLGLDESNSYKRLAFDLNTCEQSLNLYIELADHAAKKSNERAFNGGTTSDEISKLTCRLIDIKDGDTIYDLGSGTGAFLVAAYDFAKKENKKVRLLGTELKSELAFVSKALLTLRNADYQIITVDALRAENQLHYSKAYAFPAFGVKYAEAYPEYFNQQFGELFNTRSNSEWYFVFKALSNMDKNGRLVALLPEGALFRSTDRNIRKYLLNNNLLEGIISLPTRVLESTGAKTDLVILGSSNGSFKAVDATEMVKPSKSYRTVRIDDEKICKAYSDPNVQTYSYEEAANRDYSLDLNAFSDINIEGLIDNPTDLSDVSSIIVGTQYTISRFKNMFSEKPTKYQVLTSGNIENGLVDYSSLQYIEDDDKLDKFALQEGDVVVTTKSTKVKTFVATDLPDRKIIVTGGMLIVRPDKYKINPTYLKMFLDSQIGQSSLRAIQKGSIITTISVPGFKHLKVACPDLAKQNALANKYNSLLSMYDALLQQMKDMQLQISTLYDDSLKGDD